MASVAVDDVVSVTLDNVVSVVLDVVVDSGSGVDDSVISVVRCWSMFLKENKIYHFWCRRQTFKI